LKQTRLSLGLLSRSFVVITSVNGPETHRLKSCPHWQHVAVDFCRPCMLATKIQRRHFANTRQY